MRRLIPFSVVVALLLSLFVTSFIPAPLPPPLPVPQSAARISYACPVLSGNTTQWSVVGVSADGQLLSAAIDDQPAGEPTKLLQVDKPNNPIRVATPQNDLGHTLTWAAASGGSERGISAVNCSAGDASTWFTGIQLNAGAVPELTLINLDASDAAVDISIYGNEGRVNAPGSRGILVAAQSTYTVPLSMMHSDIAPIAIHVETSKGRVAAFLRQRFWKDSTPLGSEWVSPAADPAANLVVAGIPAGVGERKLVVMNASERTVPVSIEFLGPEGVSVIPDATDLELPPLSVRSIELADGIAGLAGAVRVKAADKGSEITAALIAGSADSPSSSDVGYAVATPPIPAHSLWMLPTGKKAKNTLLLTNPGSTKATVSITASEDLDSGEAVNVLVPPNTTLPYELPQLKQVLVRLDTTSEDISAAVSVSLQVGKVSGLTIIPLVVDETAQTDFAISLDPRVGS